MLKAAVAALAVVLFAAPGFADDAPVATPQNELNLLFVSLALADYCKIAIDPAVATKIQADMTTLEGELNMDDATAKAAADQVSSNVAGSSPSCAPTDDTIVALQGMLKDYANQ